MMDREYIYGLREQLRSQLPEKRFQHSLGVEFTAAALAMRYGYDVEKAEIAGLMHDCAKKLHDETPVSHAVYGPETARELYGIEDEEILQAIRWHTTGRADMSLLEKILYVADFIEPSRAGFPELPIAREWAFRDLTYSVYLIAEMTLAYLKDLGKEIYPETVECYQFLKENGNHDEQ